MVRSISGLCLALLLAACGGGTSRRAVGASDSPNKGNENNGAFPGLPFSPGNLVDGGTHPTSPGQPPGDDPTEMMMARESLLNAAFLFSQREEDLVIRATQGIAFADGKVFGTLQELGPEQFSYSPAPADRLVMVPRSGPTESFVITEFTLNETETVAYDQILDAKHSIAFSMSDSEGFSATINSLRTDTLYRRSIRGAQGGSTWQAEGAADTFTSITGDGTEHFVTSTLSASAAGAKGEAMKYSNTRKFRFSSGYGSQLQIDELTAQASASFNGHVYEMPKIELSEFRKNSILWELLYSGELFKDGSKVGGLVQTRTGTSNSGTVVNTEFVLGSTRGTLRSDVVFPMP